MPAQIRGTDFLLLCTLEHLARQAQRMGGRAVAPISVFDTLELRGWMRKHGDGEGLPRYGVTHLGRRELARWFKDQARAEEAR